jgi:hypothetical protein
MAKVETTDAPRYTADQLRAIIRAGMSVSEARMLLDDGFAPDMVLELAHEQVAQEKARLADANLARATETATAVARATNPSNQNHPGKSCMAYPEGDVARPRPRIEHVLLWNGYPQHKFQEELSWMELELLTGRRTEPPDASGFCATTRLHRGLVPGVYDCLEKDGRTGHKVSVKATKDANDRIEKLEVTFAVMRERKESIPPVFVWLYQMVHADTLSPRESFMKAMMDYITLTFKDEEAKREPVGV